MVEASRKRLIDARENLPSHEHSLAAHLLYTTQPSLLPKQALFPASLSLLASVVPSPRVVCKKH